MSDRLISADKAKEVLKHLLYETAMNNKLDIADIYADIAENRLDTWLGLVPTVDAEPKQAYVIVDEDGNMECSNCGSSFCFDNYCGHCGAKLIGERKDEVKIEDIIYRQNAIELAMQYCPDDDGTCSKADEDMRNLLDELEDLPSAVRHGHWTEERNPMMYQLLPYVWVCDQCGTAFYYKTPYCGECGAKMDERKNGQ
jgi:hypothetical protein